MFIKCRDKRTAEKSTQIFKSIGIECKIIDEVKVCFTSQSQRRANYELATKILCAEVANK